MPYVRYRMERADLSESERLMIVVALMASGLTSRIEGIKGLTRAGIMLRLGLTWV